MFPELPEARMEMRRLIALSPLWPEKDQAEA
jgi:hypothetical protein